MKRLLIPLLLMLMVLPLRAATKDVLFARILPDRTTLYAGDSMLVSVVLYATAPIAKAECTSQFVVRVNVTYASLT